VLTPPFGGFQIVNQALNHNAARYAIPVPSGLF
jgi:hypothetical protein